MKISVIILIILLPFMAKSQDTLSIFFLAEYVNEWQEIDSARVFEIESNGGSDWTSFMNSIYTKIEDYHSNILGIRTNYKVQQIVILPKSNSFSSLGIFRRQKEK